MNFFSKLRDIFSVFLSIVPICTFFKDGKEYRLVFDRKTYSFVIFDINGKIQLYFADCKLSYNNNLELPYLIFLAIDRKYDNKYHMEPEYQAIAKEYVNDFIILKCGLKHALEAVESDDFNYVVLENNNSREREILFSIHRESVITKYVPNHISLIGNALIKYFHRLP